MPKRRFHVSEDYQSTDITKKVQPYCKRGRTEEFLDRNAAFESVMKTCRFFEKEFLIFQKNTCSGGGVISNQRRLSSASTLQGLRREITLFESNHANYCAGLKLQAEGAMQLKDTFRYVSDTISGEKEHFPTNFLGMLNMGQETTIALREKLSQFAGVPSDSEVADWMKVESMLRRWYDFENKAKASMDIFIEKKQSIRILVCANLVKPSAWS